MSLFGSTQATNDDLVEEQRRQAEENEREEQELQERRDDATDYINAVYDGGVVYDTPDDYEGIVYYDDGIYLNSDGQIVQSPESSFYLDEPVYVNASEEDWAGTVAYWDEDGNPVYVGDIAPYYTGHDTTPGDGWVLTDPTSGTGDVNINGVWYSYDDLPQDAAAADAQPGEAWYYNGVYYATKEEAEAAEEAWLTENGYATEHAGITDAFYEDYRNAYTDYYMPQLDDQYQDYSSQNFYDYARKGTARSTAYADSAADIQKDYEIQQGNILNQADQLSAELKNNTEREQQYALELAALAEDPTVAMTQATTSVNAVQNTTPDLSSPLEDVFGLAALVIQNEADARRYNQIYSSSGPNYTSNPYSSSGATYG